MTRPQAALFDVDGTLIDSNALHVAAWRDAFAAFGIEVAAAEIATRIGMGGDTLVPSLLPGADPGEQARIAEHHGTIFKARFLQQARPFPKARELVAAAHGHGLTVVLASSSDQAEVDHYIGILGIRPFLATRTSGDEVAQSKPAPDIFATALARAGVEGTRAIAIGDTPYDAESAAKSGIRTIGLLSGGFPAERLRDAGAVALFRDAADLLENYAASPLAGA